MFVEENSSDGMPSEVNNLGLSVQTFDHNQISFKNKTKQIKQILSKNRQERELAIHEIKVMR